MLPDSREISSAFSLLAARGSGVVIGVATSVLLARGLGAASRGELAELTAWGAIGTQIAALGFSSSLPYYVARQPASCRMLLNRALKGASTAWLVACAGAGLALGLGLMPQLASAGTAGLVSIALLALSSAGLLLVQSAALGMGWLKMFVWTDVLSRACGGILVGALVLGGVQSTIGAAGALVVASLASAAPIMIRIRRTKGTAGAVPVSAVEELRYGIRSWTALTLATLYPRCIILWLAGSAGTADVGRFAVALGIAETLGAVIGTVSQTRIASMARAVAAGAGLQRECTRCLMIVALTGSVAGGVVFMAAPLVMPLLFGDAFAGSSGLLHAMLPSIVVLPTAGVFQTMLAARGMPWLSSAAPALALAVAVGLMAVNGTSSAEGAAWSYTACSSAFLVGAIAAVTWNGSRIRSGAERSNHDDPMGMPPENTYGSRSRVLWMCSKLSPTEAVAEFGCGTGLMLSAPLRRLGIKVNGWDVHLPSIHEGRRRLEAWGEDPGMLHAASFAQVPERSLDAIIASEVLEHLGHHELSSTLALFRTRLRPGGRLLVTVPNGYGWFELDQRLYRLLIEPIDRRLRLLRIVHGAKQVLFGDGIVPGYPSTLADAESPHVQWFTRGTIVRRLEEAGFRVVCAEGSTLLSGPIADLLITGVPGLMSLNLWAGKFSGRFASGFRLLAIVDGGHPE